MIYFHTFYVRLSEPSIQDFATPINELTKKVQALGMHSIDNKANSLTPFQSDLKLDYNPITPLRFSESDEGEYDDEGTHKTPTRYDSNSDDVDFTPIKTPWRKSSAASYRGEDDDDDGEINSEISSVDTNDLLTFTPLGGGETSRKSTLKSHHQSLLDNKDTVGVKSKLDLFLENNEAILKGMGKAEDVIKRATHKVLMQSLLSDSDGGGGVDGEVDQTTPVNSNQHYEENDFFSGEFKRSNQHKHQLTSPVNLKDFNDSGSEKLKADILTLHQQGGPYSPMPQSRPQNLINFITPFKSPPGGGCGGDGRINNGTTMSQGGVGGTQKHNAVTSHRAYEADSEDGRPSSAHYKSSKKILQDYKDSTKSFKGATSTSRAFGSKPPSVHYKDSTNKHTAVAANKSPRAYSDGRTPSSVYHSSTTTTTRDKLNISAEDVDDFIQEVITNTSRTPNGKNLKSYFGHFCFVCKFKILCLVFFFFF